MRKHLFILNAKQFQFEDKSIFLRKCIRHIFKKRLENYLRRKFNTTSVLFLFRFLFVARPYFRFPLPDQHADIGSQLTWRCEAKAIPSGYYFWYKDGVNIHSVPGDMDISRNVLTIRVHISFYVWYATVLFTFVIIDTGKTNTQCGFIGAI